MRDIIVPPYMKVGGLRVYYQPEVDFFLYEGKPAREVEVDVLEGKYEAPSEDVRKAKNKKIKEMEKRAKEMGQNFFLGKMWSKRYVFKKPGRRLNLGLQECDYGDYISTNRSLDDPDVWGMVKKYGWGSLANILGTNNTIVTSDGYVLLGKRSESVDSYQGCFGVVGAGSANPKKHGTDVIKTILSEVNEESGIPEDSIKEIEIWGIGAGLYEMHRKLVSNVYVDLNIKEVENYLRDARDRWEHKEIYLVEFKDLPYFLAKTKTEIPQWAPKRVLGDFEPSKTVDWADGSFYSVFIQVANYLGDKELAEKKLLEQQHTSKKPTNVRVLMKA